MYRLHEHSYCIRLSSAAWMLWKADVHMFGSYRARELGLKLVKKAVLIKGGMFKSQKIKKERDVCVCVK